MDFESNKIRKYSVYGEKRLITIDLDNCTRKHKKYKYSLYALKKRTTDKIYWRKSSSGKGLHLKTTMFVENVFEELLVRLVAEDDVYRIIKDYERHRLGMNTGVLWDSKGDKKAGPWKVVK